MSAGVIRLGVAPIAWTNSDLPELGGQTSLETCLQESRAVGFSGAEQDPARAPPHDHALKGHEHLPRAFARAGFTIAP